MENKMEQTEQLTPEVQAEEQPALQIDEFKLQQYYERLRMEQNLPLALLAGAAASVAGAIAWAGITIGTNYQIGYMAVAVGLLVGFTMRFAGKGIDKIFGILGATFAILGCLLGNFLAVAGLAAQSEGIGYFEIMGLIDYNLVPSIMLETFSPIDLLFYGLAVYQGYKFSFRKITEADVIENAAA